MQCKSCFLLPDLARDKGKTVGKNLVLLAKAVLISTTNFSGNVETAIVRFVLE